VEERDRGGYWEGMVNELNDRKRLKHATLYGEAGKGWWYRSNNLKHVYLFLTKEVPITFL
jgi:hypothetical protein